MKNILLLVHDDPGQEARLQTALDLSRALGGHLNCLAVTPPLLVADEYRFGFGERAVLSDERASAAANKTALTERLACEDVSWDWSDAAGELAACILRAAPLADLIVLSQGLDSYMTPNMQRTAGNVLMHSRVPVVIAPENTRRLELSGRVTLAWDGQVSAIATMKACVSLLALAREVEIYAVRGEAMLAEPEAAACYLSRHGVEAKVHFAERGYQTIHHLILAQCAAGASDYLVMGAYNIGRLAEVFGGTTRQVLREALVPVILGH